MSNEVKIAVLETQVERLLEKQKELTERVRANEKVVAAIGLFGSVAVAFIGAGYFAPSAEACSPRLDGEPTYCPDFDDVVLRDPPVQEEEDDEPRYVSFMIGVLGNIEFAALSNPDLVSPAKCTIIELGENPDTWEITEKIAIFENDFDVCDSTCIIKITVTYEGIPVKGTSDIELN